MHEIFISYSRRDLSTVEALATALSDKGLSVWVDRSGIEEGDAYDTQIEDAIAQTRVVIVLWSKNSIKSHWVRAEAAYALNEHKLLPLSIDESSRHSNSGKFKRSISLVGRTIATGMRLRTLCPL